jgi:hypothetical protein
MITLRSCQQINSSRRCQLLKYHCLLRQKAFIVLKILIASLDNENFRNVEISVKCQYIIFSRSILILRAIMIIVRGSKKSMVDEIEIKMMFQKQCEFSHHEVAYLDFYSSRRLIVSREKLHKSLKYQKIIIRRKILRKM